MKKILLVEDDPSIRGALEQILKEANYDVHTASNGYDALEKLKTTEQIPHLIVLDLVMPIMNGIEFRMAQLKDAQLAPIPVILLTANNNLINCKEKLKAYKFLNKPIEMSDLLYIVNNFFDINARTIFS
jgi:CheY-like chemotaxis protein